MITLPPDYQPSDIEEFMNPMQEEYFRRKLLRWRLSTTTATFSALWKAMFCSREFSPRD